MTDDLRARLESHAKAFEGMMSLIPADYYYGKDNSDQWQRKKQTKEEKRAAKKAKLDPSNHKSALDVHRENERKRKREEGEEISDPEELPESPKEGLNKIGKQSKKQKLDKPHKARKELTAEEDEAIRKQKAEHRRAKRERKKQKSQSKREQKEAKKAQKQQQSSSDGERAGLRPQGSTTTTANAEESEDDESDESDHEDTGQSSKILARNEPLMFEETDAKNSDEEGHGEDGVEEEDELDFPPGIAAEPIQADTVPSISEDDSDSSDSASEPDTPTFDTAELGSSASSSSSIVPPSKTDIEDVSTGLDPEQQSSPATYTQMKSVNVGRSTAETSNSTQKPLLELNTPQSKDEFQRQEKFPKLSEADAAKLKERLDARIAAMRAARNADGPDGKPARNRQDLIEARRQKEERRRQHKKELRQKAKQEQSAEDEAARLRGGSGSPMWSPNAILSPREPRESFSFGKVEFGDGHEGPAGASKKKGPQDVKTALEAAKKKQQRISGFDQDKRADIEDKDRWLNARKRVQGEKLRDNTSLLKKTLKRKDKGKAKSEKEWDERLQGVQAGKEAKQRRREDNLKKRKEDKGAKKGGGKPAPKPKKRPGFEGSWKLGSKGGKP